MPAAKLIVVPDAGHMGPLTHAPAVNEAIARHIAACDARPVS
jgi:pimeloyl-ACP methyl ester carboxylesterase